ncbi:MAG TPA: ACT domain-containing protein, partial [Armatimonadota bacterium]|nr:ACT domain-containing protein [Armatimonadota bacterium]
LALDWQDTGRGLYQADIEIIAIDRMGLLADLGAIFSEAKTNIRQAKMSSDPRKHTATIILQIDTTGVTHLQEVINRINAISDILSVHRRRAGA